MQPRKIYSMILLASFALAIPITGPAFLNAARADELDDGCSHAKRASDFVICADTELRQQTITLNRLIETAREWLNNDQYEDLWSKHELWIIFFTTRCGVYLMVHRLRYQSRVM